jgi:hypothetical protein
VIELLHACTQFDTPKTKYYQLAKEDAKVTQGITPKLGVAMIN